MKLYLDKNSPTLYLDMNMNNNSVKTMTITDNFPLQKWVYIIVSVDNQFVDVYLNGKLIQSMRFFSIVQNNSVNTISIPSVPPDATTLLYLGNSGLTPPFTGWDAQISQFYQWSSGPMDPQTAWKNYLKGNGSSFLSNYLGNYNLNLQLISNNNPTVFPLF
jgi:hypothetical protein